MKTSGQNKCNEHNTTDAPGYGVDIIMYQDGTVVDILGGGNEGPNTPMWITLLPSPPSSWRPPFDPGDVASPPEPPPPSVPPTPPLDLSSLHKAIGDVRIDLVRIESQVQAIATSLEEHRAASRSFRDKVVGFLKDSRTISIVAGIIAGRYVVPGGN